MKILWICNLVLPDFCGEYDIRRPNVGGWMTGLLSELTGREDVELGFCFPIIDAAKMKSGVLDGYKYFSFHASMDRQTFSSVSCKEFEKIFMEFGPDVIHVWGTEYNPARAAVEAAEHLKMANRVLVHIQGLVSIYALHYGNGIPVQYLVPDQDGTPGIQPEIDDFAERGRNEISLLKKVSYISGRTVWDRACVHQINPAAHFRNCNEVLRSSFYDLSGKWQYHECCKHTIFLSQASYPIKGLHFLLQALPIINRFYPDVQVYIGGSNPMCADSSGHTSAYGRYINSLINKCSLSEKLHFLGSLDAESMVKQYLQANVFVSPSTIENSSNSICEAMYLGVPVIASYVGGNSSLIESEKSGLLYPCDAYYMLAEYICQVFADKSLACRLSQAAMSSAEVRHDRDKIREDILTIYGEIADNKNDDANIIQY